MIKIPYEELGKQSFQQAVMKLANSTFKDPRAFAIKHFTKELREGFVQMRDTYKKDIEEKYLEKDEAKVNTKGAELNLPFNCKEGLEADCKGSLDSFGKNYITVERKKISAALLFEVNEWTPRELEALELIIDEPQDS